MQYRLPQAAVFLGIAGLVVFVALGIASVSTHDERLAFGLLYALIGYAALVLAFVGGIHWGFVLHPSALPSDMPAEERRDAVRLGLGVLPSVIGWAALLTPALAVPEVGLGVLVIGYLAWLAAEFHMRGRGMVPSGYMRLRYWLSAGVLAVLVIVLAMRLLGWHIVL
jgi:hypothetical protein